MSTRAARQIREGILLARQVQRHERVSPLRWYHHPRTLRAYVRTLYPYLL